MMVILGAAEEKAWETENLSKNQFEADKILGGGHSNVKGVSGSSKNSHN